MCYYTIFSNDLSTSIKRVFAFSVSLVKAFLTQLRFLSITKKMASNQQQYDEQLKLLQELYPEESKHKILRLLKTHDGDFDQVSFLLNL